MPMWFVWSCSSICCLRLFGMTICLPFSIMPSITASSSLYDQWGFRSTCSSSLVLGHPAIMQFFNHWMWLSCADACCISAMDTHAGMSVALGMVSTYISMSFIGLSFPSIWLYLDNQSTIKILGPGLYIIWTLFWLMFSNMHWMHCDNVATSFFEHWYKRFVVCND